MWKLSYRDKVGSLPISRVFGGVYDGCTVHLYKDEGIKRKKDVNGNACLLNSIIKRNAINLKRDEYDTLYKEIKKEFKRKDDSDSDASDDEIEVIRPTKREEKRSKLNDKLKDIIKQYKEEKNKEIKINEGEMFPLPTSVENQTDAFYICAPRGSGKSTFAGKFMALYQEKYPKNKVIVISSKKGDIAFKHLKKKPFYLELDDEMVQEPIDLELYEDTLLVFDDYENFPKNRKKGELSQQDYVNELRDKALKEGRSKRISVLVLQHIMFDHKQTKTQLTECDSYVLFSDITNAHLKRAMETYMGLTSEDVKRVMNLDSRWVYIKKKSPKYCVHEHGVIVF